MCLCLSPEIDVKPENVLVTDTGIVKLSDFGVAKILTRIEDCRSTSGTHGYMVSRFSILFLPFIHCYIPI